MNTPLPLPQQQLSPPDFILMNPKHVIGVIYSQIDPNNIGNRTVTVMCIGLNFSMPIEQFEKTELAAKTKDFMCIFGERKS
jgi:hypothetical protein